VAILGRGIAAVEQIDGKWIQAVVWNKCTLRIARKEIVWDERDMRRETEVLGSWPGVPQGREQSWLSTGQIDQHCGGGVGHATPTPAFSAAARPL
jgi:hypothetical protein